VLLLLDNYDSFVFNLAQGFGALGEEPRVVRSDQLTVADILDLRPSALVLSPGPGRPEDAGVCVAAVRALSGQLPVLGVCLGHQAIAHAFGAPVTLAPEPVHGRTSAIHHDGRGLFAGVPSPFLACRYHSLAVPAGSLPAQLRPTAATADGLLMAMAHASHPTFGLQFHPESFRTEHGMTILRNFVALTHVTTS
jgi:anthranilate synthase component 2